MIVGSLSGLELQSRASQNALAWERDPSTLRTWDHGGRLVATEPVLIPLCKMLLVEAISGSLSSAESPKIGVS